MERRVEREFEILTAIAEESSTTQRVLAARLGVALGLTNLYLKRLVKKGYIKVAGFPHRPAARKRLRYLLTARGLTEKSRLTYDYMNHSLRLYRDVRQHLSEVLRPCHADGAARIALFGTGGSGPALLADTTHYFQVRSTRSGNASTFVLLGSTATPAFSPAGTAIAGVSSAAIGVSWSASGYRSTSS